MPRGVGENVVAYVVADPHEIPRARELRTHLEEVLPAYMVPSAFVFLDSLPLTPNGKIDRAALPRPETTRPDLDDECVAPTTEVEKTLAQIWEQVLGIERVGIHDHFVALGGDSIQSVRVVARAKQCGLLLAPRDMFQYPIEQLAKVARHAPLEPPASAGPNQNLQADASAAPFSADAFPLARLSQEQLDRIVAKLTPPRRS